MSAGLVLPVTTLALFCVAVFMLLLGIILIGMALDGFEPKPKR